MVGVLRTAVKLAISRTDEVLFALLLTLSSALLDFGDAWKAAMINNVMLGELILLGLLLTQYQASQKCLETHTWIF